MWYNRVAKTRLYCLQLFIAPWVQSMRVLADLRFDCSPGAFLFERSANLMMQCKLCFKFRYEINEYGECKNCSVATDKRKDVVLHVKKRGRNEMTPFISNYKIMTKERWLSIRGLIDRFYSNISMDEIEDYNDNVVVQRSIEKEALRDAPRDGRGVIYLLKSNVGYHKIGKSINLDRRIGEHLRDYPVALDVIHVIPVLRMTKCEVYLLSLFDEKRMQGEWFALSTEDVEWICSLDTFALESLVDEQ